MGLQDKIKNSLKTSRLIHAFAFYWSIGYYLYIFANMRRYLLFTSSGYRITTDKCIGNTSFTISGCLPVKCYDGFNNSFRMFNSSVLSMEKNTYQRTGKYMLGSMAFIGVFYWLYDLSCNIAKKIDDPNYGTDRCSGAKTVTSLIYLAISNSMPILTCGVSFLRFINPSSSQSDICEVLKNTPAVLINSKQNTPFSNLEKHMPLSDPDLDPGDDLLNFFALFNMFLIIMGLFVVPHGSFTYSYHIIEACLKVEENSGYLGIKEQRPDEDLNDTGFEYDSQCIRSYGNSLVKQMTKKPIPQEQNDLYAETDSIKKEGKRKTGTIGSVGKSSESNAANINSSREGILPDTHGLVYINGGWQRE